MLAFYLLPDEQRPLADKFYRSQRSVMRTRSEHRVWVAKDDEIVAALCLQPAAHGQWLTSLLVAAGHRRQGVAGALLEHALGDAQLPTWLFCHPDLQPFYERRGFTLCAQLPAPLSERLARYRRTKILNALVR